MISSWYHASTQLGPDHNWRMFREIRVIYDWPFHSAKMLTIHRSMQERLSNESFWTRENSQSNTCNIGHFESITVIEWTRVCMNANHARASWTWLSRSWCTRGALGAKITAGTRSRFFVEPRNAAVPPSVLFFTFSQQTRYRWSPNVLPNFKFGRTFGLLR